MSKAIVLNEKLEKTSEFELPKSFDEANSANLYLYVKSYLASLRANTAVTKSKGEVRGGGKKPWGQKGRGGARAGSNRSPIWVGGGVAHGPKNNRNYYQKINKKQKRLALECALSEKAQEDALYIVDSIAIESGKTKDAANVIKTLGLRDVLIVKELIDEKSFYSFRNLKNAYLVEPNELNAYLVAAYHAVIIEKAVLENIVKEG
jgi:large subunit ribosomal protein L4